VELPRDRDVMYSFCISYVNISVLHLIVLILSHFQEISKKVRTEEQTATKEILQRIFPDIRIEDNKVKYNYFVAFIILSLVLHGSDTWPVKFMEEYKLKVLECRVLRKNTERKRKAVTGNWGTWHNGLRDLYCSANVIR
jgi:hypothetical protein